MSSTLRRWLVLASIAEAAVRVCLWCAHRAGGLVYHSSLRITHDDPNDVVPVYRAIGPLARVLSEDWAATTFHEAIVIWCQWDAANYKPGWRERVLRHEAEHVRQRRRWGIFFLLAYLVASLCAMPHPYRDNCFERAARRASWRLQ